MNGVLTEMTVDEVRALRPEVMVIPVGSVEPHGPALPYGTDSFECEALGREGVLRANRRRARALLYPTLPVGNNVNFKAFPFACRIRVETLIDTLLDIVKALEEDGLRKIVLVNGHGGNTEAIRAALRIHMDRTPAGQRAFVCVFAPLPVGDIIRHPSEHGGESETSNVLHLRGDLVKRSKIGNFPFAEPCVAELKGCFFVRPWHLYVPASAGGDSREASADKGRRILERNGEHLARLLVALSRARWHPDFPYRRARRTRAS